MVVKEAVLETDPREQYGQQLTGYDWEVIQRVLDCIAVQQMVAAQISTGLEQTTQRFENGVSRMLDRFCAKVEKGLPPYIGREKLQG